jgi:hypothetical protein
VTRVNGLSQMGGLFESVTQKIHPIVDSDPEVRFEDIAPNCQLLISILFAFDYGVPFMSFTAMADHQKELLEVLAGTLPREYEEPLATNFL